MWNNLTLKEKAELILAGVKAGYRDIDSIRERFDSFSKGNYLEPIILRTQEQLPVENVENSDYSVVPKLDYYKDPNEQLVNRFDKGGNYTVGNLVDAIYLNNPKEEFLGTPSHNYDFTQSEEWANAHGYYPDARGHRDDRVKKPAHPSHPSRGTWQGDNFILTDKGFEDPNYTLFGLNDGGQDPLATLIYDDGIVLPEITVTPNSKYINNSYDNIRLHLKSNGGKINRFDDGGPQNISFYELANDPQYGYHLIDDGKNGQPTYYNANTGQWFLASKALDEGRLSEIKSGDTFTPIIANPVPELPAVSNYISSLISNMLRPLTEELALDKLLEKAKETFSYFPGIGEAIDVYDAGTELLKGNYGTAAAGLGLMLLPEWAEKGVRKGGKYIWNWLNRKTDVVEKAMGLAGYKKLYHGTHNGEFELPEFRSSENNFGIHMSSNRHVSEKFTDSKSPIIKEAYVKTSNAPMVLDMHANDYNMFNPRYSVFNPYVVKDNKYIEKLDFYPDRGTTTEMYYKTLYPEYTHKKRPSNLPFADYHVEIPVGTEVRTMNMQELNWPNMSNEAKIQWLEIHNKVLSGQITKSEANDAIAKMLSGNKIPVLKYRNSVPGELMASNLIDYIITDPNAFKLNMPRLEIPNWMLLGIGASTAGAVYGAHKLTEDDD